MIVFPNCKINLGLKVLEKRSDGYHNIESVFIPVNLCDALETIKRDKFFLRLSGINIEGNIKDNLVVKAYELLKKIYGLPPAGIHLFKAIPSQAGLGGGSADATFMLRLLNDYFSLGLTDTKLYEMSLELGSDCPFFLENKIKYVTGRGDILENIDLDLKGYYISIVKPDIHISTPEAYDNIIRSEQKIGLKQIIDMPVEEWKIFLHNDFENYAFQKFPLLRSIKNRMYDNNALYASMSGSGSTIYGIFESPAGLKEEFGNFFYWEGEL